MDNLRMKDLFAQGQADDQPEPDFFARVPRKWSYGAFIDELRPLIEEVKHFEPKDKDRDGDRFKVWRHKVSSLCHKIDRTHVDSNCDLDSRQFRVMSYNRVSSHEQREAFDRDMRDTITELEHIVQQYESYGEPALKNAAAARALKPDQPSTEVAGAAAPAPTEREWPKGEKASWKWIRENIPFSVLYALGGFIVAVAVVSFGLGMWVDSLKTPTTTVPMQSKKP
jgi:hypothetical protein